MRSACVCRRCNRRERLLQWRSQTTTLITAITHHIAGGPERAAVLTGSVRVLSFSKNCTTQASYSERDRVLTLHVTVKTLASPPDTFLGRRELWTWPMPPTSHPRDSGRDPRTDATQVNCRRNIRKLEKKKTNNNQEMVFRPILPSQPRAGEDFPCGLLETVMDK